MHAEVNLGTSGNTSNLTLFGAPRLEGLRRRPRFAAGDTTTRCIAKNAWEAGMKVAEGKSRFRDFVPNCLGFFYRKGYKSDAVAKVLRLGVVRLRLSFVKNNDDLVRLRGSLEHVRVSLSAF